MRLKFHSKAISLDQVTSPQEFMMHLVGYSSPLPQRMSSNSSAEHNSFDNDLPLSRPQLNYIRTYFRIHCMINIIIALHLHSILMNRSNANVFAFNVDDNRNYMVLFLYWHFRFASLLFINVQIGSACVLIRFIEFRSCELWSMGYCFAVRF